ncbi:TIGR04104 family putative zinc finger protein [Evansella tamaricis]|uniref:CXXC-20-CXXC protein n=1 Tax=Evansella tamaricis TaxID=2069301 RepID=A0ABS6JJH5_9BACI|nr:TIGR04104 family putative zinc finger protein [Evansella tamaricis]MBU9713836.1 hypothetical protein [Evansella tamaricis]
MPKCQNCNKRWSWKQTLKSGFVFDTGMKCPFCDSKQYTTKKTRIRFFLSLVVIILPMILPAFFNISPIISLILIFVLGALFLLINPFYTELSNEDPTLGK